MTRPIYSGSVPLMWLQERTTTTPLIIGCTACRWWIAPNTGVGPGRGWRHYETLFNRHRDDKHPEHASIKPKTGARLPIDNIADPDDPRHGTTHGAKVHRLTGIPTCQACADARNANERARYKRKQAA